MNGFLRTTSLRHLLTSLLGLTVTVAAGTTIAIAAIGTGPVPRPESLARAIHQGLAAPAPDGVYARITFTNNLIDSGEIQGSDPLLTGGSGRLWWTGHHLRLEIQGDNGDAQVVVNGRSFWAYDPAFKTVYEGTLPASGDAGSPRTHNEALPSAARIQDQLDRLARHLRFTGPRPENLAGQPAYSVRVSPRHDNGLLGSVELVWDALHRSPLEIGLYARGNPTPVLALSASDISFGPQSSAVFAISPPAGAKVIRLDGLRGGTARHLRGWARGSAPTSLVAIQHELPFTLTAPAKLAGRGRSSVRLLRVSDHPAALLSYGHGIGTVLVLEQAAGRARMIQRPAGDGPGLSLLTVNLGRAAGQQLQTAIGTLVRFTRTGVTYTVLGSVPASVADAAARGL